MDLPAAHGAAAVHARGGARAAVRGGAEHRRAGGDPDRARDRYGAL